MDMNYIVRNDRYWCSICLKRKLDLSFGTVRGYKKHYQTTHKPTSNSITTILATPTMIAQVEDAVKETKNDMKKLAEESQLTAGENKKLKEILHEQNWKLSH